MMTLRRARWAGAPLALSIGLLQCSDSYTANEFAAPDLATSQGTVFDFATNPGTRDLATSTFPAPTITSVAPAQGPNAGNTALTITGTGFQSGATVKVADVVCNNVKVVSATSITCTTAGKAATCGPTTVVVANPDQKAASSGQFAYAPKTLTLDPGKSIANGANSRAAVWADMNGDYGIEEPCCKVLRNSIPRGLPFRLRRA